jgi:hypothetical protein
MSGFFAFYTGGKGGRRIPEISCWPLTLTLSHRERGPIELVDFSAYYPDFLLITFRSGTIEFVDSLCNTLPFSFLHHFPKPHELIKGSGQPPRPLGEGEGKQTTLELALQGNDQKEAEISAGKMAGCKNGG